MTDAALELIDASKSFNHRKAVDSLSFQAAPGDILGFLGPNGAGKSTSLRMALGVVTPDSGQAQLFGKRPNLKSLQRVGFLPEERGLYRRMSPRGVIAYFARLKGMTQKDALARADDLLERHGLGEQKSSKVSRLSKGMAQKVQILAALAHTPDLIILDEPFSGLDPVNQQDLEQLIREEHARGATIVFSTHVMEHAERLCDRLLIIGAGKKCFDGTIDEALSLIPESALLTLETDMDLSSTLESRGFKATRLETTDIGVNWRVDFPNGGAAQDVLRAAIDANAPIVSFTPQQARLRDVFVKLTGETAHVRREDGTAPATDASADEEETTS
ncbi:MAG: ABC transporter ATP-binding protein [Hirschia sp.]|nr:ABC transporter ATP-binding protein [Hirschia sp.]MBF19160.1 ABC transporter ATP-binding protein [Hirschia sp.]